MSPTPTSDRIVLTKHHGLGNDFLVTFDTDLAIAPQATQGAFARWLCDRSVGIGADGLIIGRPAPGYDQQMILHNSDGSRAEISGNGIRCFAHALAMRTGSMAAQLVLTDAGDRRLELSGSLEAVGIDVSVDMGSVGELDEPADWAATGCHPDRPVVHLTLGNPHSVVGVEDVDDVDLAAIGATVPDVNLEIVAACSRPDTIRMRVHERGVGITQACGSGAVASAVAATRWGLAVPNDGVVNVMMDGGSAQVVVDAPTLGRATLVGPAVYVGDVQVDRRTTEPDDRV